MGLSSATLLALNQLPGGVPKAYLRVLSFNQDSVLVDQRTVQLTAAALGNYETLSTGQLIVQQDGYVSVYVGNESATDVYFDDVTIEHRQGLQIQENHYDPFGLDLAGVNATAPGLKPLNQYKFNGKEFQTDLGLNWNHQDWRFYDTQLGRWHVVDPEIENAQESWTPYSFGFDNAIRYSDSDGRNPILALAAGAAIGAGVDYAFQVGMNHYYKGQTWGEASSLKNINTNSIMISGAAGLLGAGLGVLGVKIATSATIGIGAKAALSLGLTASEGGVLASESVAKQATDPESKGTINKGQVATDVAVGMLTGGLPGPRLTNTAPLARAVSRAENIAAKSVRAGRAAQTEVAKNTLRRANLGNGIREVASGVKSEVIENTGQMGAASAQSGNSGGQFNLNLRPSIAPADNTRVAQSPMNR